MAGECECCHGRCTTITSPLVKRPELWYYYCLGCRLSYIHDKVSKQWLQLRSWAASILRCLTERFLFPNCYVTQGQFTTKKKTDLKSATRAISISRNNSSLALQIDDVTLLTALYFFITSDGDWQWAGFDPASGNWKLLRPLTYLPPYCKPNLDLFKEYQVCTKGEIVCMNVSKSTDARFIVFNVMTGIWRELPQLIHPRNPVLMHLAVDALTRSYQVIVAGSSSPGQERLSRTTEVFDSRTWKWRSTDDVPGPDYALNDYQSGVCKDGYLYCIAFLDQGGRGILQYNLKEGVWIKNWACLIPFSVNSVLLQLVESWGELYLFSEEDIDHKVEHCIYKIELKTDCTGRVSLSLNNVVRRKKVGGRSLEVLPEHICVPYSEHQLCVFNANDHSGVVYDVQNCEKSDILPGPPPEGFHGENLFSLNAMSFTIEPNFKSGVLEKKKKKKKQI